MGAICLVDTSIFVEILDVPQKASQHKQIMEQLREKIRRNEFLFLPMATILETGNHIAQNGNGDQRRRCAEKFVIQVQKALKGESPFKPMRFLESEDLQLWLTGFPDSAMRGSGLGDLSIIHDWQNQCRIHPARRVYIWFLDKHLLSCDRPSMI